MNQDNCSISVRVKQILVSSNINELVLKFPLQFLGESSYNVAIKNVGQWFTDEDIEKYSLMGVLIEVENE